MYVQPANELPTQKPTANIDVKIISTRPIQNTSRTHGCLENEKFYTEGENWSSGSCRTCNCTQGEIICSLDENCSRGKNSEHIILYLILYIVRNYNLYCNREFFRWVTN